MSNYAYYEGCGFLSDTFRANDTDSALAHVLATFRNPSNVDFDGDEGGIVEVDADGWCERVALFAGVDLVPDPWNERQAYQGPTFLSPGE